MKTFFHLLSWVIGLLSSLGALAQPTIYQASTVGDPICPGVGTSLIFNVNDTRAADNKYTIYFYPASYSPVPTTQADYDRASFSIANVGTFMGALSNQNQRSANFTVPRSLAGGRYKIFIASQVSSFYNTDFSNPFTIKPLATLTISGNPTIIAGQPAPINFTFTGTPPFSVDYNDYSREYAGAGYLRDNITFPTTGAYVVTPRMPTFVPQITYDNVYVRDLRDASGCPGPNTVIGSAVVKATPMQFSTQLSVPMVCAGEAMDVFWTIESNNARLQADFVPVAQLSDASGNFGSPVEVGRGSTSNYNPGTKNTITARIPATSTGGTGYKIRVVSTRDDYNLLIAPQPQALTVTKLDKPNVANTNPTVCQGDAAVTLAATGTYPLKWTDFAGNAQPAAPTQGTGTPGSYGYFVYQANGTGCTSEKVGITVKVKSRPGAPGVAAKEICQNGPSYTLEASSIGSLRWFNSSDALWNGNGSTPVVSTGTVGPQTFKVDQQVDGCYSDKATVTVTINAPPAAPAVTPPAPVCQYADVPNLTANGLSLKWYTTETGGTGQNTAKPSSVQPGTTPYWVSQTDKGCEGPRAKIEQTINPASPDPTTATVLLCKNQQTTPLTAIGTSLKWYEGNGVLIGNVAPTPATTQTGDFTYRVTQTTTGCESKKVDLLVSVRNTPGAPGVAPVSLCQNQVAKPLTATGDGLSWYEQETGGTSQTALTPQTSTIGDKVYWVSQRFGTCEGPRAKLLVTVNAVPAAPAATGKDFCINDPATPLLATGEGLRWYTTADHTGPSQASVTPTTDRSQNLTYYVTQTKNGCESATTAVQVHVRAKAMATLTGDDKVFAYDSTAIRIKLDGDGPWSLTLWSGQAVTTSTTPYVKWVTPNPSAATASYKLQALRNDCGPGDVGNNYTLTVQQPLATLPLPRPAFYLLAYPSPATTQVTLDWQAPAGTGVTLRLVTLLGRVGWQVQRTGTGLRQTENVDLSQQAADYLIFSIQTTDNQAATITLMKQ